MVDHQAHFRHVMSHYPTGVCAITGYDASNAPCSMIVGSFTSVSLDPAMIGFLVGHQSTTWPKIAESGKFCVNVLAKDQSDLCTQLASSVADKCDGVDFITSSHGSISLARATVTIECAVRSTFEMGDHLFVLADALALAAHGNFEPMVFFRNRLTGIEPALEMIGTSTR